MASTLLVACQESGTDSGEPSSDRSATSAVRTTPPPSGAVFPRTLGEAPTPVRVREADLEVGAPPRVEYVASPGSSQVVVRPDGSIAATLEVEPYGNEGYRHLSFAPYDGGWLTSFDSMGPWAELVGPDGRMAEGLGAGPFEVFSRRDRREVVFTFEPTDGSPPRAVATLGRGGLARLGPADSTAGFLGQHEVVVTTRKGVFRVDLRDRSRTRVPGLSSAKMVSSASGWLIGDVRDQSGNEVHGVYDARTGDPVLGSPTYELVALSPSGAHVLGYRGSSDRIDLVIADVAIGRVVQAFRLRSWNEPHQVVWEDEDTLLVDFRRFRLDGTVERPKLLPTSESQCCPYLLPPPVS